MLMAKMSNLAIYAQPFYLFTLQVYKNNLPAIFRAPWDFKDILEFR